MYKYKLRGNKPKTLRISGRSKLNYSDHPIGPSYSQKAASHSTTLLRLLGSCPFQWIRAASHHINFILRQGLLQRHHFASVSLPSSLVHFLVRVAARFGWTLFFAMTANIIDKIRICGLPIPPVLDKAPFTNDFTAHPLGDIRAHDKRASSQMATHMAKLTSTTFLASLSRLTRGGKYQLLVAKRHLPCRCARRRHIRWGIWSHHVLDRLACAMRNRRLLGLHMLDSHG